MRMECRLQQRLLASLDRRWDGSMAETFKVVPCLEKAFATVRPPQQALVARGARATIHRLVEKPLAKVTLAPLFPDRRGRVPTNAAAIES